jgi:hypothetical protein
VSTSPPPLLPGRAHPIFVSCSDKLHLRLQLRSSYLQPPLHLAQPIVQPPHRALQLALQHRRRVGKRGRRVLRRRLAGRGTPRQRGQVLGGFLRDALKLAQAVLSKQQEGRDSVSMHPV